jgi:hypothetical protein
MPTHQRCEKEPWPHRKGLSQPLLPERGLWAVGQGREPYSRWGRPEAHNTEAPILRLSPHGGNRTVVPRDSVDDMGQH